MTYSMDVGLVNTQEDAFVHPLGSMERLSDRKLSTGDRDWESDCCSSRGTERAERHSSGCTTRRRLQYLLASRLSPPVMPRISTASSPAVALPPVQ